MESFQSDDDFAPLAAFVQQYGGELFHAKFLTLANLRGILHRGVDAYLDSLGESEESSGPALGSRPGKQTAPRRRRAPGSVSFCWRLSRITKNTRTTTPPRPSRTTARISISCSIFSVSRPPTIARPGGSSLCSWLTERWLARDRLRFALAWQSAFAGLTEELSARFIERLSYLEQKHGIRLRTVADRIGEQFTRPLALDRVCALVEPAMVAAGPDGASPALDALTAAIEPLASNPSGVGLDVPHWLRRLEAEVERIRGARLTPARSQRTPFVCLARS